MVHDWKFAFVTQFFAMFGADLNLPDFLSDELEQLFVVGAYEDVTFAYLALKMMRKVSRKVNSDNWHSIYEKECRKRDYDSCSKSLMDYEAKERVALLKNICEWILDDCEKKGIEGIKTAHVSHHFEIRESSLLERIRRRIDIGTFGIIAYIQTRLKSFPSNATLMEKKRLMSLWIGSLFAARERNGSNIQIL